MSSKNASSLDVATNEGAIKRVFSTSIRSTPYGSREFNFLFHWVAYVEICLVT